MRWRVKYRVHLGVTFAPSVQRPEVLIMSHRFDSGHPNSSLEDSAKGNSTFSSPFPSPAGTTVIPAVKTVDSIYKGLLYTKPFIFNILLSPPNNSI